MESEKCQLVEVEKVVLDLTYDEETCKKIYDRFVEGMPQKQGELELRIISENQTITIIAFIKDFSCTDNGNNGQTQSKDVSVLAK